MGLNEIAMRCKEVDKRGVQEAASFQRVTARGPQKNDSPSGFEAERFIRRTHRHKSRLVRSLSTVVSLQIVEPIRASNYAGTIGQRSLLDVRRRGFYFFPLTRADTRSLYVAAVVAAARTHLFVVP